MEYAFDEFYSLAQPLAHEEDPRLNPQFWYCAALCAELAYYHVPEFEIDARKRAKLVPLEDYQAALDDGVPTSLRNYLSPASKEKPEFPVFVVETSGVVAVAVPVNNILWIGMRGTILTSAYDWSVNLSIRHRSAEAESGIRIHSGYFREALSISAQISLAAGAHGIQPDKIFFCGHSLGGAVAALSQNILPYMMWANARDKRPQAFSCVFGSPRYANLAYQESSSYFRPAPIHIRRDKDIVPNTPPRVCGYADPLIEYDTSGNPSAAARSGIRYKAAQIPAFLGSAAADHRINRYRNELALLAHAAGAGKTLIDRKNLTARDTK